jgi:chromate transport protein ChrA
MNAAVKILIGLILIAIGLGLFVDSVAPIVGTSDWIPNDWLYNFLIVLTGFIPPFLIIIGLFVVWLEIDEIKAEREIRAEEEKEKKEKSKKAKK